MTTALTTTSPGAILRPTTMAEAMQFAEIMSKSDLVPRDYKGKPGNVLVAVQMGSELGLAPMQSLQNIAVINGRPSVWGDALLALVQAHRDCDDVREWLENGTAYCEIKRKGRSPTLRTFSPDDARKAKLWGKPGPWTQYTDRMLQLRARGFALRDAFADVLRGLITAEEAADIPTDNIKPAPKAKNRHAPNSERIEKVIACIAKAGTEDELTACIADAQKLDDREKMEARRAYITKLDELKTKADDTIEADYVEIEV